MKPPTISFPWKQIISTMNDVLMVIALDGTVVMVNPAFETHTGYTKNEVIGQPCTILECDACELTLNPGKSEPWCALFDPSHEGIKQCRCNLRKKDGTYMPALKNASVLRDDQGAAVGSVETLTDISELDRLDREVVQLSRQLDQEEGFYGIIGKSVVMQRVFDVIQKAAKSDAPVIIYGESGTGKELAARAIHMIGSRRGKPYVQLNCAALNESLLESELFGHTKGAFTGAFRHRAGRFEVANGGDIFLDEVGDIPLSIQVKLLRVIETKKFERVGDHQPIHVDVRIITATNKNLEEMLQANLFREDLFYRINVLPIYLPPLRDRQEDIPVLVNFFIRNMQRKTHKKISGLTKGAMEKIMAYYWPGNIRELKSALEYAFVIAERGAIDIDHLSPQILKEIPRSNIHGRKSVGSIRQGEGSKKEALMEALRVSRGNKSEAARILGVNRVTVWNRMKKYGIDLRKVLIP
ncbi:sigma-54 interaction domain-containing protein [Thermodesulfobacteriota bacterium]